LNIADRTKNLISSFLRIYGPSRLKKVLWDRDFSSEKWDFIDNTVGDCVYTHLEKYAQNGDILDLGCGPGNTANELNAELYRSYIGVDISEAALAKAVKRTEENGRADKNSFVNSDFLAYTPNQEFDIILFRESMYHIPFGQVMKTLEKYAKHLKRTGVFMVRLYAAGMKTNEIKHRVTKKIDLIKREFDVLEAAEYNTPGKPTVLVFRPRLGS
jgi:SAM-dependent methyltransferase